MYDKLPNRPRRLPESQFVFPDEAFPGDHVVIHGTKYVYSGDGRGWVPAGRVYSVDPAPHMGPLPTYIKGR